MTLWRASSTQVSLNKIPHNISDIDTLLEKCSEMLQEINIDNKSYKMI